MSDSPVIKTACLVEQIPNGNIPNALVRRENKMRTAHQARLVHCPPAEGQPVP